MNVKLFILILTLIISFSPSIIDKYLWYLAEPRPSMKNVEDFMKWRGDDITGPKECDIQDKKFLVYSSGTAKLLASSTAVYVFDEHGVYVDWAPEAGEKTVNLGIAINSASWD